MIGEIRQNFTEASASVGLILATALILIYPLNNTIQQGQGQDAVYRQFDEVKEMATDC